MAARVRARVETSLGTSRAKSWSWRLSQAEPGAGSFGRFELGGKSRVESRGRMPGRLDLEGWGASPRLASPGLEFKLGLKVKFEWRCWSLGFIDACSSDGVQDSGVRSLVSSRLVSSRGIEVDFAVYAGNWVAM